MPVIIDNPAEVLASLGLPSLGNSTKYDVAKNSKELDARLMDELEGGNFSLGYLDVSHIGLGSEGCEIESEIWRNKEEYEVQRLQVIKSDDLRKEAQKEKDFPAATSKRNRAKEIELAALKRKEELTDDLLKCERKLCELPFQKLINSFMYLLLEESASSSSTATTGSGDEVMIGSVHQDEAKKETSKESADTIIIDDDHDDHMILVEEIDTENSVDTTNDAESAKQKEFDALCLPRFVNSLSLKSSSLDKIANLQVFSFRDCNLHATSVDSLLEMILENFSHSVRSICFDSNPGIGDRGASSISNFLAHNSQSWVDKTQKDRNAIRDKIKRHAKDYKLWSTDRQKSAEEEPVIEEIITEGEQMKSKEDATNSSDNLFYETFMKRFDPDEQPRSKLDTEIVKLHTRRLDINGKLLQNIECISLQNIGIMDDGFADLLGGIAKLGDGSLKLVDVRSNPSIEMDQKARETALQGTKVFNKQCKVAH